MIQMWRLPIALLLIALLAACATPPPPPAPIEERDVVGEVREEAAQQDGVIEVFPLNDPTAAALVERARAAEDAGDLVTAADLIAQALEITPRDPDYWQHLAELKLRLMESQAAIDYATQSYELGPKIGQLCYRNWLVIQRAREQLNDPTAADALNKAQSCTLRERERF